MGFKSWLTGRNELYADDKKINSVIEQLQTIKSHDLKQAKDDIGEAVQALNNCTGFQEYVGSFNANSFDPVIDASGEAIDSLVSKIEGKVDDMKAYSESGTMTKVFSTLAMAGAKFAEGVLSVGEDLGDGVVSVVGWAAPKNSGVEKWCEKFVKKEWSHDAFNFYYKSDFAKASAFTEDSALASTFKIAGSVTGYLALGGVVSGAGGVAAKSGSKVVKAVGTFASSTTRVNTATAALTGMGSGTESGLKRGLDFDKAAHKGVAQGAIQGTLAYGVGKFGEYKASSAAKEPKVDSFREASLKEAREEAAQAEKNFYDAYKTGSRTASDKALGEWDEAVSKVKAIETFSSDKAIQGAEKEVATAEKKFYDAYKTGSRTEADKALNEWDDAAYNLSEMNKDAFKRTSLNSAKEEAAQAEKKFYDAYKTGSRTASDKALSEWDEAVSKVKAIETFSSKTPLQEAKDIPTQGYNDIITKAGQKVGGKLGSQVSKAKDVFEKGRVALRDTASASSAIRKNAVDAGIKSAVASESQAAFKASLGEASLKGTATKVGSKVVSTVKAAPGAAVNIAKAAPGAAVNAVKAAPGATVNAVKAAPGATVNAVKAAPGATVKVVGATPGVAILNATGREIANGLGDANNSKAASEQFKISFDTKMEGVKEKATEEISNTTASSDTTTTTSDTTTASSDTTTAASDSVENAQNSDSSYSSGGSNGGGSATYQSSSDSSSANSKKAEEIMKEKEEKSESINEVTPTLTTDTTTETSDSINQVNDTDSNTNPDLLEESSTTTGTQVQNTENNSVQQRTVETLTDSNEIYHTGGEYSEGDGYVSYNPGESMDSTITPTDSEIPIEDVVGTEEIDDIEDINNIDEDVTGMLDSIVNNEEMKKIPVAQDPISTSESSGTNTVISTVAGLSAAGAAGLGTKAYMDHKRNNSDDEEIESDEWNGNESTDIDYGNSTNKQEYLDDDLNSENNTNNNEMIDLV